MRRNPYLVRTPISTDEDFVGRRADLARLYDLVSGLQAQSSCLYGERRIGKTSLLRAFERRYKSELEQSNVYVVVPCDVEQADTPGELILQLLERISATQQELADFTTSPEALVRQVKALAGRGQRLVLLVDDFDAVVQNPRFNVEFFNFLRSLVSSYPVSMVLTSRRRLIDVCHSGEVRGSPFFNVFHERRLDVFTAEEVRSLIGRGVKAGVDLQPWEAWIRSVAGAFPLFLQMACGVVMESQLVGECQTAEQLSDKFMQEAEPHFNAIWTTFGPEERAIVRQIAGAAGPVPRAEVKRRLTQAGYLVRDQESYRLFSSAFGIFALGREESEQRQPRNERAPTPQRRRVRVFVSYAHEDKEFLSDMSLGGYLSGLERSGIEFWDDRKIGAGREWKPTIINELQTADIVLLLISQYWLNSEFIRDEEIRIVMQRRAQGLAIVIPVIVAPCAWESEEWLSSLQLLPPGARPLTEFTTRGQLEAAFLTVFRAVRDVAEQIRGIR